MLPEHAPFTPDQRRSLDSLLSGLTPGQRFWLAGFLSADSAAPVAAPAPQVVYVAAAPPVGMPAPTVYAAPAPSNPWGLWGSVENTERTRSTESSERSGSVTTQGPGGSRTDGYRDVRTDEVERGRRSVLGF